MAKKKSDKETEPKKVSTKRFSAFLKNETTHFVIGLISVIFAVYLLLAFTSFFFTGAADQSILDNQQPGELMQTANHVKNYAGARGAQLAEFLINECFGLAAYFIILFLAVVGMKLMKAYQFRIWKWFMSCSILLIWFSITLGFIFDGTFGDSFIYPGGLHGHNVSNWLISQIGIPGLGLLLFIAALLFFIYLSNETILVIRKALRPSFRRKKKEDQTISATEENPIKEAPRKEESRKEFSNPGPAIVDFELEQPTKKEEEVEEQVPFPFESKHTIGEASLLFEKIEDDVIQKQLDKLAATKAANQAAESMQNIESQKDTIQFDDFQKMDIRVPPILAAEKVAKTKKLLKLTVDTGLDRRVIVSGIAEHFTPEELVGRQVLVLVNLAPRELKGIVSNGMILMAEDASGKLRLLQPGEKTNNGATVG